MKSKKTYVEKHLKFLEYIKLLKTSTLTIQHKFKQVLRSHTLSVRLPSGRSLEVIQTLST